MPRYFFTTVSERRKTNDEEGVDLPDAGALNKMACTALAELLASEGYQDRQQSFSVHAADERGDTLLTATLDLTIREHQRA